MKPRTEACETLDERSRKYLGTTPAPIPCESTNDVAGAHTPGTSDGAETAYQRRRDQVRKAQRSHRQRKENYIRRLEQEVLALRHGVSDESCQLPMPPTTATAVPANDNISSNSCSNRERELEAKITYLESLIQMHGIGQPEQWWSLDTIPNPTPTTATTASVDDSLPQLYLSRSADYASHVGQDHSLAQNNNHTLLRASTCPPPPPPTPYLSSYYGGCGTPSRREQTTFNGQRMTEWSMPDEPAPYFYGRPSGSGPRGQLSCF